MFAESIRYNFFGRLDPELTKKLFSLRRRHLCATLPIRIRPRKPLSWWTRERLEHWVWGRFRARRPNLFPAEQDVWIIYGDGRELTA